MTCRFLDLVNELRGTEARRYTLQDTPVTTAIYHPAEETSHYGNERPLPAGRSCEPVDVTPVWFMRQAGCYMAEYRAIRGKYSLIEICQHPDIAAEVTMQPVPALGVDAAILFADILRPAIPPAWAWNFPKGKGLSSRPRPDPQRCAGAEAVQGRIRSRLRDGCHSHPARDFERRALDRLLRRPVHGRGLISSKVGHRSIFSRPNR